MVKSGLSTLRTAKRVPELIERLFEIGSTTSDPNARREILSAMCWLRTLHEPGDRQLSLDLSLFDRAEWFRRTAREVKEKRDYKWAVYRLEMHASDLQALAECGYRLAAPEPADQ